MRHNLLLNRSRGTASLQPLVLLAIIVVMTGAQAVLVPGSLTVEQMLIISRQASALGIITLGQAAVILVGGCWCACLSDLPLVLPTPSACCF